MNCPLVRLDVDLGAEVSLPAPVSGENSVAISRDGTRLAYTSGRPTKLFTRRLDQTKAVELKGTQGTQGAQSPFFSPDGQWVGFSARGKLNKISVESGAVVPLGDIDNFAGASWGEDGSILASSAIEKGCCGFPSVEAPPETVAPLGNGVIAFGHPQILPGGKAVLFATVSPPDLDKPTIEVLTLADRHRKIVARGGNSPRYLATSNGSGHLVYVGKATLFAIPFDLDTLETRGTAVPVLDDVAYQSVTGTGQFDVSRTGTLVYRRASGGASAMTTVQWVDPTGKKEPLRAKPGVYANPSHSPDGRYVVFLSFGNGIFQARADGAGQPQPLTQSKTNQIPSSFTPDGKRLASVEAVAGSQIWIVPLEDQRGQLKSGKPEPFLKSSFVDQFPSFSPDGRWLAYQSNESGKDEVYVRAFPPPLSGQGGKWQISNSGGAVPRWSRTGLELVYQSGDQIMIASYTVNGDTFLAEKPRVWIPMLGAALILGSA